MATANFIHRPRRRRRLPLLVVQERMEGRWGFASTAAILRATQKDLFYRQQLETELRAICQDWLNAGVYLQLESWIPLLGNLLYYGCCTGIGRRTLGEEYARIVPVDVRERDLLLHSRHKRLLHLLLTVVLPFALGRAATRRNGQFAVLAECVSSIAIPVNTALFYWFGRFPSISQRVLSIRHIYYPRRPPSLDVDSFLYRSLAPLLLAVTAAKSVDLYQRWRTESPSTARNPESQLTERRIRPSRRFKCPMCLDPIDEAMASSRCGHVFCWPCISKWLAVEESTSCPVCRVECDRVDLLPLANFA